MAKGKKAASGSSIGKKKAISSTSKKPVRKTESKINIKKAEVISEKITKMNKDFEVLISQCQDALQALIKK